MKQKIKILSSFTAGVMAFTLFTGVFRGIVPDMGVSAVNISEKLYDEASKLYYYKFDDNDDGAYDHIEIGYEHAGLQSEYDGEINYSGLKNAVIPNELDGLPVTKIGTTAFVKCPDLETAVIPESVVNIGGLAFEYCPKLKSVTIKNPECQIYNNSSTISNGYYENENGKEDYYSGTIIGYSGSAAQSYAKNYGYKFEAIDGASKEYDWGDANLDGYVNVLDASCIAKAIAQKKAYILPERADFDRNGIINVLDASAIARYIAGGGKK